MQVLAFVNQKGGCGKTTVAINLAGALAALGRRTLLVDLDPQAHATLGLGCAPAPDEDATLLDVLAGEASIEDALVAAPGGIWLVPAAANLAQFEEIAARMIEPEHVLAARLEAVEELFDCVLLDCPPRADGVLTANALCACDTAVLVVETGAFALQGALAAQRILLERQTEEGQLFDVRVLATLFDRRLRIAREILIALQARFGERLFDSVVRESARLREVAAQGAPVQVLDPASRACADFHSLAQEVLLLAREAQDASAVWDEASAERERARRERSSAH